MKKLSTKSKVPWFDNKIKNQKVICRRAERRWLKTKKQADMDNFKSCRNFLHRTIYESKSQYYTNLIMLTLVKTDCLKLFIIVDSINNKQKETPMPPDINPEDLPNGFSNYFKTKIDNIRKAFKESTTFSEFDDETDAKLCQFKTQSVEEISRLIKTVPTNNASYPY